MARLAAELSDRYDDGVVMIAVLRGSVPFLADLVRAMTIRTSVDFVALSPYTPGTGRVRLVMDTSTSIEGRDVVIVEDIVDTGLTAAFLQGELGRRSPAFGGAVHTSWIGRRAGWCRSRSTMSASRSRIGS